MFCEKATYPSCLLQGKTHPDCILGFCLLNNAAYNWAFGNVGTKHDGKGNFLEIQALPESLL